MAFHNKLTCYHKEVDAYARFSREVFPWWNAYLVNWADISRWLLAMIFFSQGPVCRCPNSSHVGLTEAPAPDDYAIPQVNRTSQRGRTTVVVSMSIVKQTSQEDRCSVCNVAFREGQEYRHWIEEFLERDADEPRSYPLERVCPQILTNWDLRILIVGLGKMPCGFICSPSCFAYLDNHGFPHRMRRLNLCRRRSCNNINVSPPLEVMPGAHGATKKMSPPPGLFPSVPLPKNVVEEEVPDVFKRPQQVAGTLATSDQGGVEERSSADLNSLRGSDSRNSEGDASNIETLLDALEKRGDLPKAAASFKALDAAIKDAKESVVASSKDLEAASKVTGIPTGAAENPLPSPAVLPQPSAPPPPPSRQLPAPEVRRPDSSVARYRWDLCFTSNCRFGCLGNWKDNDEVPFTPDRLITVPGAQGSFGSCQFCQQKKTMAIDCFSCHVPTYCDMPCQLKDKLSHDCSTLRLQNFNRILHFGKRLSGQWAMVSKSIDLLYAVKNFHRCRACFPFVMQVILNKNSSHRPYMASWFHLVVRNIFGMHRLGVNETCTSFSLFHLGALLDIMEQMVQDAKDPELMAKGHVDAALDALYDVYVTWMRDFRSQQGLPEERSGQQLQQKKNFYSYETIMDMDAALKYCHVYATSLCAHASMAQVEDESLASQRERAATLERLYPMFAELVSCQQASPLLSTFHRPPHVLAEDPLLSVRAHVLENFSRIFSYCSPLHSSPALPPCISYDLMVGVMQGQEPSVEIKTLESRLIMTITLIGWFYSKLNRDFLFILFGEFSTIIAQNNAHIRKIYYQPAQMGQPEDKYEVPTTLLQNYVILVYSLATQAQGVKLIQEIDMLRPLADMFTFEFRQKTSMAEKVAESRNRRKGLAADMQNPELFHVSVVQMLKQVYESAGRTLNFSRMRVFLCEEGSFMILVRCLERSGAFPPQELGVLREGLEGFQKSKALELEDKLVKSIREEEGGAEEEEMVVAKVNGLTRRVRKKEKNQVTKEMTATEEDGAKVEERAGQRRRRGKATGSNGSPETKKGKEVEEEEEGKEDAEKDNEFAGERNAGEALEAEQDVKEE